MDNSPRNFKAQFRLNEGTIMAVKTTTTTTTTVADLVKASLAVVSAQEKIYSLAKKWDKDEFTPDDSQLFSAEYRLAYLKRFAGKSKDQATSATTSAVTTIRLAMHLASKAVTVKRNGKIVEWFPSESLLKTRKLVPATPPATTTTPPATTTTPATTANITKSAAMEALNRVIAFANTQKLMVDGKPVTDTLTAIARAINADD